MSKFCSRCGSELSPGNKFCPKCGQRLSPAPAAPETAAPRSETPGFEAPRPETPRPEAPRPETPRPEASRPETPRPEASRSETSRPETPRPETPRPETPRPETPKSAAPKSDAPDYTPPKAAAPKHNGPKRGGTLALVILLLLVAAALVFVVIKFALPQLRGTDTPEPSQPTAADTVPVSVSTPAPAASASPDAVAPGEQLPTWQESYSELLDRFMRDYPDYRYTCCYSMYDIDSDGVPEILIKLGTCEADFEYRVYTYPEGTRLTATPTMLGSFDGGHASVCGISDHDSFLVWYGHMGWEQISEMTLTNGSLSASTLFSGSDLASYHELTALPIYELDDLSGLDWYGDPVEDNRYALDNFDPGTDTADGDWLAQYLVESPDRYYARLNVDSWQANDYKGPFVIGSTLYTNGFGIFGNANNVYEWVFWIPKSSAGIIFDYGPDAFWQYGDYSDYGSSRIEFVASDGTVLFDSGTFTGSYEQSFEPVSVSFDTLGYTSVTLRFTVIRGTEGTMNIVLGDARVTY